MAATSAFDLAEVTEQKARWKAAYNALASGKNYSMSAGGSSRTLTRQDLETTRDQYFFWSQELQKIEANKQGINMKMITPIN